MNHYYGSPDPPRTLAERLTRLNDNLRSLGERLKASIAGVVGDAIADAVRDAVRSLLGSKEAPADPYCGHPATGHYRDREDDPWGEEDRGWEEEVVPSARETRATRNDASSRWHGAMSAALQAALWFLEQQPRRRPVLTTLAVTLAAGVTGFVAGPALAVCAGVLASAASLLLTAPATSGPAAR
jgi:hypothetical protein